MRPKPKPTSTVPVTYSKGNPFKGRDSLGAYLADPASFPSSRVIYFNDDFVAVNDLYPKSSIHILLLPRSKKHARLHPFDAFDDAEFLASVQNEVSKLKALVAKELQRKFGRDSRSEAKRQAVLNGEVEPEGTELPVGRKWEDEIITGIHAKPSMNHIHIHMLSKDMSSKSMKHRKHYNSFNTPFLIDVDDFPLADDDLRRDPEKQGYLDEDLVCWRCGKNFGNKFKSLKDHLTTEFEGWRKE
jgi:aprataxin